MIVKAEKLAQFLAAKDMSNSAFAKKLGVEESEVDKMLSGENVGLDTSRKFIRFFKAEIAQRYIDWETMQIRNPLQEDEEA